MLSTIAVKDETLEMLKILKEEKKAKNFDEVIKMVLSKPKQFEKSYFGKFKGLGKFKREEIDRIN